MCVKRLNDPERDTMYHCFRDFFFTCLTTDACLRADPGVPSSILTWSHTFPENKMISTVILLPFADSFKKGCCQLQAKVYAGSTG